MIGQNCLIEHFAMNKERYLLDLYENTSHIPIKKAIAENLAIRGNGRDAV